MRITSQRMLTKKKKKNKEKTTCTQCHYQDYMKLHKMLLFSIGIGNDKIVVVPSQSPGKWTTEWNKIKQNARTIRIIFRKNVGDTVKVWSILFVISVLLFFYFKMAFPSRAKDSTNSTLSHNLFSKIARQQKSFTASSSV